MLIKKTNETILRTVAITSAKTFAVAFCFLGFFGILLAYGMRNDAGVSLSEILIGGIVSFFLFISPLGYWFYWLYKQEQKKEIDEKYKELKGVGGWLLLFLVISVFQFLELISVIDKSQSAIVTSVSAFFILLYLLMFGLFLKKSRKVILLVGVISLFGFLLLLAVGSGKEISQSFIALLVWPTYFLKSKRIRQTFVN